MIHPFTFIKHAFADWNPSREYPGVSELEAHYFKRRATVIPAVWWGWFHLPGSWYFCTATIKRGHDHRTRDNLARQFVVGFDDVNIKARPNPITPHCKLVSSYKGGNPNEWWFYFIEPHVITQEFSDQYDGFWERCGQAGISDPASVGTYRLARLPGSRHKTGHRATVVEWNPDLPRMTIHELAEALGVGWGALKEGRRASYSKRRKRPAIPPEEIRTNHPVVRHLVETMGYPMAANGDVPMECPFSKRHTNKNPRYGQAIYFTQNNWFHCSHNGCKPRGDGDRVALQERFKEWLVRTGGPDLR